MESIIISQTHSSEATQWFALHMKAFQYLYIEVSVIYSTYFIEFCSISYSLKQPGVETDIFYSVQT